MIIKKCTLNNYKMSRDYKRITKGKYDRRTICQHSVVKEENETYVAGELIKEWDTATQINEELGFDKSAILRCCKGIQQKSYWYIWKFKDIEDVKIKTSKDKK